jgi:hypothetical protein
MIIVIRRSHNRKIIRLDELAFAKHILPDLSDLRRTQSFRGKFRSAVIIRDTDNNIAAAPVADIAGKSGDGF